jgi:4-methyl-5(b-hydroxyethyl)-thiazole monophosphate biosynthesis
MARVLVPLAQGCEELEAVTIIDLLRRANIDVVSASLDGEPIRASRGVRLLADMSLDDALHQDYDMVALPGGLPGADHLTADPRIQKLLRDMAAQQRYTAAICAAPKALAHCGLLDGKQATAYPGTLERLNLPNTTLSQQAVVTDGKVITSRGPGTAMDFALRLIEALTDKTTRDRVEAGLERMS